MALHNILTSLMPTLKTFVENKSPIYIKRVIYAFFPVVETPQGKLHVPTNKNGLPSYASLEVGDCLIPMHAAPLNSKAFESLWTWRSRKTYAEEYGGLKLFGALLWSLACIYGMAHFWSLNVLMLLWFTVNVFVFLSWFLEAMHANIGVFLHNLRYTKAVNDILENRYAVLDFYPYLIRDGETKRLLSKSLRRNIEYEPVGLQEMKEELDRTHCIHGCVTYSIKLNKLLWIHNSHLKALAHCK